MLQELKLTICSFRKHGRAEGFHDLLDGNSLAGELIFSRAVPLRQLTILFNAASSRVQIPDEPECTHTDGLQVGVPDRRSINHFRRKRLNVAHLLVISNVVPKIWALTNSAILTIVGDAR
jgi:hypothetical protein